MRFFDLHCDTLTKCLETGQTLSNNRLHVSFEKAAEFDRWRQCFALWFPDGLTDEEKELRFMSGVFLFCEQAPETAILTVENAEIVLQRGFSVQELAQLYGVRMLSLTWNRENALAGGCNSNGGLTAAGKAVVKACEKYGVTVDVSHLNERSVKQVLLCTDAPVVASHCNLFSVCEHRRNLSDEIVTEIVNRGGLIGLCFMRDFLGCGNFYKVFYRHVLKLLDMNGEKSLAIGSDFDGCKMPRQINSIGKIPILHKELTKLGLENLLAQKLFFDNAQHFFGDV